MQTHNTLTTYRRHYCTRKHRSWLAVGKCLWSKAHWVAWDGPGALNHPGPVFALVSRCRGITVTLHTVIESAERTKALIDSSACGGACRRDHQIIRLDPGLLG